jgi:hypothetical protein
MPNPNNTPTVLDSLTDHLLTEGDEGYKGIVKRNIDDVTRLFDEDPTKILVSVQLEADQVDHLKSGLSGRSRRLLPLPVFARLLKKMMDEV